MKRIKTIYFNKKIQVSETMEDFCLVTAGRSFWQPRTLLAILQIYYYYLYLNVQFKIKKYQCMLDDIKGMFYLPTQFCAGPAYICLLYYS